MNPVNTFWTVGRWPQCPEKAQTYRRRYKLCTESSESSATSFSNVAYLPSNEEDVLIDYWLYIMKLFQISILHIMQQRRIALSSESPFALFPHLLIVKQSFFVHFGELVNTWAFFDWLVFCCLRICLPSEKPNHSTTSKVAYFKRKYAEEEDLHGGLRGYFQKVKIFLLFLTFCSEDFPDPCACCSLTSTSPFKRISSAFWIYFFWCWCKDVVTSLRPSLEKPPHKTKRRSSISAVVSVCSTWSCRRNGAASGNCRWRSSGF